MLALPIILLFLAAVLPKKHAFGLAFVFQNMFYTYEQVDIGSYMFLILLLKLGNENLGRVLRNIRSVPVAKLYVLMLIFFFLGSLRGGTNASEYLLSFFRCGICLIAFIGIFNDLKSITIFVRYVFVLFVLVLFHIHLQYLDIHPLVVGEIQFGRLIPRTVSDESVDPNTYAGVILYCSIILLFFFRNYQGIKNRILRIGFNVLAPIVILTAIGELGSRGALISFLLIYFIWLFNINYRRIAILVGAISLFLTLGWTINVFDIEIPLIGEAANERLQQIDEEAFDEDYQLSRGNLARTGFQMFLDHPIIGVGFGAERDFMARSKYLGLAKAVHNTYLTLLVELGFFGIILIFRLLSFALKRSALSKYSQQMTLVLVCSFLILSFTFNYLYLNYSWIFLAVLDWYKKNPLPKVNNLTKA